MGIQLYLSLLGDLVHSVYPQNLIIIHLSLLRNNLTIISIHYSHVVIEKKCVYTFHHIAASEK